MCNADLTSPCLRVLTLPLLLLPLLAHAQDQAPAVQTVVVPASTEPVVKKLDKTVYDVAGMARAANGTAQDVLQSTPEVSVTADGKISVKGHNQVTVLINGKPTAMLAGSGDEQALALQTMSGADIASVEVITNPSAAYNANGGAILNIVLKHNRKPGAHAQLQGSAADHGLWNVATSGDVTRGALSVHGNLAYRRDGTLKMRDSAVDWNNPVSGLSGQTRQTSEIFVRRSVESATLGLDYALSEIDSISLTAQHNRRRSLPLLDELNATRTPAAETLYHRISFGPNEQSDNGADLAYSHQERGAVLKAALQHSATHNLVDKSYRDVFIAPALPADYTRSATASTRRLTQATVDWSQATTHGQWGAGLDIQNKVDDIANYQAAVDPLNGSETQDPETTNRYAARTTLSAAYLTDKFKRGQWEALLGARVERMGLRVTPAQGAVRNGHWQAFNPSLHLRYEISDNADIALSYRRSLQMPDARDLNPFTTYIDAQNLSRGNSYLKPQLLNSWEVNTNADAGRLSGSAGAFYRTSRDTVTDARTFIDDVLVTSKQNGGQARLAGVTASLEWNPGERWRLGMDGGAYQVVLTTPDTFEVVHQSGVSGYLNLRVAYHAGPDDLSLDAHAQSAGIAPLGRFGVTNNVNLTWKHQLNKTLSLTVNANDIFDGSKRTYSTEADTFRRSGFDHFVARRLYVGFTKKLDGK